MKKEQKSWVRLLAIMLCFLLTVSVLLVDTMAVEINTADQSVTEQEEVEQETDIVGQLEQEEKTEIAMDTSVSTVTEENSVDIEQEDVIAVDTEEVAQNIDNIAATDLRNPRIEKDSSMSESGQKVTWDCIWFGSYPQSEITSSSESIIYNKLKNLKEEDWNENNDVIVDGAKYRRLKGEDATYYYFKYEPIKWRVLTVSGKEVFLLSDITLDEQKYNMNDDSVTWETSCMRSWLNGYEASLNQLNKDYTKQNFINSAFSLEQKQKIISTNVINKDNTNGWNIENGNSTQDNIFILSELELYTNNAESYGFVRNSSTYDEAKRSKTSMYAKAMGAYSDELGNCEWWLRTKYLVYSEGNCSKLPLSTDINCGVRPALSLDLSDTSVYSYAGTVCSNGTVNEIVAPDNGEEDKIPVTGVSLNQIKLELKNGDPVKLEATIIPSNATNQNVIWSSSDESVVTVDQSGIVSAVSEGSATITVTTEDSGLTATCEVTVVTANEVSIFTLEEKAMGTLGNSITLNGLIGLTVSSQGGESVLNSEIKKISWKSSNPEVAEVENCTGTNYNTFTKRKMLKVLTKLNGVGTTVITGTTSNGKEVSCTITVETPKITPVTPRNGATDIDVNWGEKNNITAKVNSLVEPGSGTIMIILNDSEQGTIYEEISASDTEHVKFTKDEKEKTTTIEITNIKLPYGKTCYVLFKDAILASGKLINVDGTWHFTTSKYVFKYGRDTFNFSNSPSEDNFNVDVDKGEILDVNKELVDKILGPKSSFALIDRVAMYGKLKESWRGSCQGMTVLTIENLLEELGKKNKELDVECLYSLPIPANSQIVRTYLAITSVKQYSSLYRYQHHVNSIEDIQDRHRDIYEKAKKVQLQEINPFCIGYGYKGEENNDKEESCYGHAILAYGVEEGNYEYEGKTYIHKILVIDPNLKYESNIKEAKADASCIYFTKDFRDFCIPHANSLNNGKDDLMAKSHWDENGNYIYPKDEEAEIGDGVISYAVGDISVLDPDSSAQNKNYVYISDTAKEQEKNLEEAKEKAKIYFKDYELKWSDKLFDTEIRPYINVNAIEGKNLESSITYVAKASDEYKLNFTDGYIKLDIQSGNSYTDFSADSAESLVILKDKTVKATSLKGTYELGFASEDVLSSINEDEIIILGKAFGDDITITPSTEGVIIENSNGMNNITVKVSTGFDEAEKTFTEANATTALVKTIEVGGEEQVKIYIDKDKDGTFETDIDEASTINLPSKTTITSLENVSEGMKLRWNKVDEAEGYQIQYDTSKDFISATSLTVKGASTVSKDISGLTVNKKYYVRVRAYKTVNNKKYYAKWSDTKTITIKEVEKPVSTKVKNFVKKYVSSSSGKTYTETNVGNYVQILKGISTWNDLNSTEQKQANELISSKGKVNYKGLYNAAEKIRKQRIADDDGNLASIPMTATGKSTSTQLTWSSVKGADGYYVYANRCNKGDKKYKWKCVKTIKSGSTVTYTHKNLLKNTAYKYRVGAYATINGKKVLIARSLILHSYTTASSPKYKNPSKVTVSNDKVSLKVGKTKKITAKISGYTKGKMISNHVVKIRYIISDPAVASISLSGTMKAKKVGSCTIWACAQNGVRKAIKVTVTK